MKNTTNNLFLVIIGHSFMVPRSSLKFQHGVESFISYVVLIKLYKTANTGFRTEPNMPRLSIISYKILESHS
jgi:hypothetical protein